MNGARWWFAGAVALSFASCKGGETLSPAAVNEAKEIFGTRCTTCHGPGGKGDGPASAGMDPKPRNLADASFQKSVTDEYLEKIIKFGGAAVGKSAAMPPNPDLNSKDEVVKALRAHVRSLAH